MACAEGRENEPIGLTGIQKAVDNSISSLNESQLRPSNSRRQFFNNKQPISVGV
jgi:hypothetical protein